jgi:hypothetical protein
VKLNKGENKVCKFDAHENGFLIKIYETLDSKGKTTRVIHRFKEIDSSLIEAQYQNIKGITNTLVKYENNKELERTTLGNRGIQISKSINQYDAKGNKVIQQYWRKGKLQFEEQYFYDDFGLCIKREVTGKNVKRKQIFTLTILEKFN